MPFSKQKSLVFRIRKGLVLVGVSFWFTFFSPEIIILVWVGGKRELGINNEQKIKGLE